MIREEEPAAPSSRASENSNLAQAATCRACDVHQLIPTIRGDLDWITMLALQKDRQGRYSSVAALADDVTRHLNHEPIHARPPSIRYRARKFARRHRSAVVATTLGIGAGGAAIATGFIGPTIVGGVALAGLVVGLVHASNLLRLANRARDGESRQRQLAEHERAVAQREADAARVARDKSETIVAFLEETFRQVSPAVASDRDTQLLEDILSDAMRRIARGELAHAPEAELRLRLTVAKAYTDIGAFEEAGSLLEHVEEFATAQHGANSLELANAQEASARLHIAKGEVEVALRLNELSLDIRRRIRGDTHTEVADSLRSIAYCQLKLSRLHEALANYQRAFELYRSVGQEDSREMARSLLGSGRCLKELGRPNEALNDFRTAHELNLRSLGETPFPTRSIAKTGLRRLCSRWDTQRTRCRDSITSLSCGERSIGRGTG